MSTGLTLRSTRRQWVRGMQGQLTGPSTGSASELPSLAPLHDPAVSVVVGTWSDERWADLTRVVAALREQTLEPREVILVVDGNPELLERARTAFPDVRCVANALGPGAPGARNAGVREASGDVVAFVDDDAEPEPIWLEELADGFREAGVLGVGGDIRPHWEVGRPRWFPREYDWVVGCTYA